MQKETKIKVAKIILSTIGAAGFLTAAMVAPNAVQALDLFYGRRKRNYDIYKKRYYINSSVTKLKDRGFIKFEEENGKKFLRLTEKGERELLGYQLQEKTIEKPKKWDKKWRVIIFDIKEYRRGMRDRLRKELVNLGFIRLQNSVWVYPYDCEEVVTMLKSYFCIGKDVLYMVVERIENDRWLRKEFNLE